MIKCQQCVLLRISNFGPPECGCYTPDDVHFRRTWQRALKVKKNVHECSCRPTHTKFTGNGVCLHQTFVFSFVMEAKAASAFWVSMSILAWG